MANYKFVSLPDVPNDSVFERSNFMRGVPHTSIFSGKTGLVFRNCNLTNCELPVGTITEDCLKTHVSFCSHLHPEWLEKGYILECASDCTHRTVVDTVTIDGVVVDTNYTYEDKGV